MRYRSSALAVCFGLGLGACVLVACGNGDDTTASTPTPEGGSDASGDATTSDATPDAPANTDAGDATMSPDAPAEAAPDARDGGGPGPEGGPEGGGHDGGNAGDASDGATAAVPVFLTHFSVAAGGNPEGLWEVGDAGTPIVSVAPLAQLVTVAPDGGQTTFGTAGDAGASATFTLGIVTDAVGNVYAGVGSAASIGGAPLDAGVAPAPGVYRFPPGGGVGTLYASDPNMKFPNGLDFVGTTLFVADSGGTIFTIDTTAGTPTPVVWSTDALLAPSLGACDGGPGLSIGANGIVHDANNVYVTNTDIGSVIRIPMVDGGAGTGSPIVSSCAFAGADGIALDSRDNTLLVAVNIQDKIVRVALDGGSSVVVSGSPLDAPASLFIDTATGTRRLLFTNASFFSAPDAATPGLLAVPIP